MIRECIMGKVKRRCSCMGCAFASSFNAHLSAMNEVCRVSEISECCFRHSRSMERQVGVKGAAECLSTSSRYIYITNDTAPLASELLNKLQ